MTGTPLMRRLSISLASFSTVVSGDVVTTALTITSLALIRPSYARPGKAIRIGENGIDLDQRNILRTPYLSG
jgi:hypothetical protein